MAPADPMNSQQDQRSFNTILPQNHTKNCRNRANKVSIDIYSSSAFFSYIIHVHRRNIERDIEQKKNDD